MPELSEFERELMDLINKHCKENDSGTPDFVLARYLQGCLENLAVTIGARELWYDREINV